MAIKFQIRQAGGMHWLIGINPQSRRNPSGNSLNEIGAYIWEQKQSGCTVCEIAEGIAEQWDVTRAKAEADTQKFLQHLNEKIETK